MPSNREPGAAPIDAAYFVRPGRDAIAAALLVFLTSGLCILLIAAWSQRSQIDLVRGDLQRYASAAAGLIDGDKHARITSPDQMDSAEYLELVNPLVAMHRRVPDIAYLYTFREQDGKLHFVLDTATQADRLGFNRTLEASAVMDEFSSDSPEEDAREAAAVREGRPYVSPNPTRDEFGTFITGLAPIYNAAGKPVGAVGVDLDVSELAHRLDQGRLAAAGAVGVAGLVSLLVGIAVWRIRRRSLADEQARRRAQVAWLEAESRRALLIQALGEVVYHYDYATDTITYSEGSEGLIGFSAEQMPATPAAWLALMPEEDRARVQTALARAKAERAVFAVEYRMQRANGGVVWVSDRGVFTFDADGNAAALDGVMVDVTQRRLSDERFRVIFEATSEPHFLVHSGVVLDCNQAAVELLGAPGKLALVGMPVADFWAEYEPPAPGAGLIVGRQASLTRMDKSQVPVEIGCGEIIIGGRPVVLVVGHDLTGIKQAESSLLASEARYRELVENLEHVIFQTDLEGRLTFLNPAWERITGYTCAEALGRPYMDFVLPEDLPLLASVRERQMSGASDVEPMEIRARREDGHVIVVQGHCRLRRDASGTIVGITGVLADVTELRDNERELMAARDIAEKANRAKSEFLAVMSHEIRTPLNGVLGFSSLLSQTTLDATQQEYLRTIANCGDTLLAIIDDVLDFSRMESGRLELERREFDLRECIEEVLDVHATRAVAKGLDLVADVHPAIAGRFVGDSGRLAQVLSNLVGNAVKFTQRGGIVVTAAPDEETPATGEVGRVVFTVCDSGIGIPAEKLDQLFEPFVQADSTMARRFGGAGLGLAICRRLVEAMDGTISVTSAAGKGATFRFTARLHPVPPDPEEAGHAPFAGRSVALVMPPGAGRAALGGLLESLGIRSTVAETPEALDSEAELLMVESTLVPEERLAALGGGILLVPRGAPAAAHAPAPAGWIKLGKPVRRADLVAQLRAAFGLASRGATAPVAPAGSSAGPLPEATPLPDPAHTRILVVEDNVVNQKLIVRMLSALGYPAIVVASGDACLSVCEAEPVDLLLMDIQMPGMDGFATTERLRARGDRAWIVALTAHVLAEDRERCIAAGMNDFLPKPIRSDALREVLARFAASRVGGGNP